MFPETAASGEYLSVPRQKYSFLHCTDSWVCFIFPHYYNFVKTLYGILLTAFYLANSKPLSLLGNIVMRRDSPPHTHTHTHKGRKKKNGTCPISFFRLTATGILHPIFYGKYYQGTCCGWWLQCRRTSPAALASSHRQSCACT